MLKTTSHQFVKFVIVGLISKLVIFLLYLAATGQGISPKTAMSWLYLLGVLQTFYFNKSWTFDNRDPDHLRHLILYLLVYGCGYILNLMGLIVFVDQMGFDHRIVQGVLILGIAVLMFVSNKLIVFR